MQHASGAIAAEILEVLRLAFTFRVNASRVTGRDGTIALLALVAFAIWAYLGWFRNHSPLVFDFSGLPGLAAVALAALALAWLLSRLARPPLEFRRTLWLVAGYLPAVAAAGWLLNVNISRTLLNAVAIVLLLHATAYFFFGMRALAGGVQWRALGTAALWVVGAIALGQRAPLEAGVWSVRQSADEIASLREAEQRTEELLYAQADRIDAALRELAPSDPGEPSVYFLGFAGYGDQKVFAEEIALAERRIHERFGIEGRRVLLVNDRRDFDRHALASVSGLRRALHGMAARMDRDRDVLFLALSSHGKPSPHLVVSNASLPLGMLKGETLATMLRETGIRWKVIVISACYAGGFIEHLRDEHTIVITAAAPDKVSFGCNDRRELTYFGEAFYRDALPQAPSLRAAFDAATADIDARERRLGLEPSMPRAHFGAAMQRKLDEIEAARLRVARN